MAIHKDHPGLSVEIVVNGNALREYENNDQVHEPETVARYLQAQPGAKFGIRWSITEAFPSNRDISHSVWIDGRLISQLTNRADNLHDKTSRTVKAGKSFVQGEWSDQKLVFATGDADLASDDAYMQGRCSLGLIKVAFSFVTIKGPLKDSARAQRCFEIKRGAARPVQVNFGERQIKNAPEILRTAWQKPFAVFEFSCRTRTDLEAIGIIPRSLSPAPIPVQNVIQTILEPVVKPEPEVGGSRPARQSNDIGDAATSRREDPSVEGLSEEEIIVMIVVYRGGDAGLAGQSKKSLLGLLKFYEDKDKKSAAIKREPATESSDCLYVKRERDDSESHSERKRSKPEVIVLDD
ncbi:hypothetical protein C7974DRAFT_410606 [Boeremia exigua]|uniref:uncharacterized protein n=1 Tax=Boeremia exigua TaxID=749465 RepID=UPI001E8D4F90|nr:uncharacterized protein C7974DRAFT_410606 [Boeremia exigua]KAH6639651.1 hypothetical protein C7974DRAFT_410606 [Boeremia exigua]